MSSFMPLSRRTVLSGAASAVALAACGEGPAASAVKAAAQGQRKIGKVGLQTYTLRKAMAEDFKGTFQMIKDIGYDYVELNNRNWVDMAPTELKAMLNDIGLPTPAAHISMEDVAREDISGVKDISKTLELKYAIVPWVGEDARTLEDWKRHARLMNAAGEKLADSGTRLAYHNHQFEFDDLGGGTTAMDVLLTETVPDNVDFELDIFWANLVNVDILALFAKYPGRFKLCHIKDLKGDPAMAASMSYQDVGEKLMVNVGEGDTDFAALFALNDISGMEYFIAEHDRPKPPYKNAVSTSLTNIRNMRF